MFSVIDCIHNILNFPKANTHTHTHTHTHTVTQTHVQHYEETAYKHTYIAHTQPRDPCPSYPVISYTFNISEDNNIIATINHTGNASVNINGSSRGLVRDHIYLLIIEAMNNVGRTTSDEILLCKYYFSAFIICILAQKTSH